MNPMPAPTPDERAVALPGPTPDTPPPAASAAPNLTRRTVLAGLLLGSIFTLLCVQWSMAHGRLSQDPTFDDSFYLWDGAHRLNIFFREGPGAFFRDLVRQAPHSPFSTLGATLAFAVFGVHDWAPYALINGGVLLALLACAAYLARAFSLRWRLLSMWLVLTLPLAIVAVHDYRPDFACALLTAASIYLMVESAGITADASAPRARLWRWAGAGLGFGLALLVKPSFFLHTLFMEGLALGAFALLNTWIARSFSWRAAIREAGRALGWMMLPTLVIATPYYVVHAHETYQYFVDRSVGQHGNIWRVPGGLGGLIWYNTAGLAGTTMLGTAFFLDLVPFGVALVWLAWRRHWQDLATQGCLLLIGAVSLAIVVAGKLPNPFFPLTCFLLLVFVAWRAIFNALADFLPLVGARRWPAATAAGLLLFVGVANVTCLRFTRIWEHDNPSVQALVGHGRSYNARILADMEREMGVGAARTNTLLPTFVTTAGFINATTLRWLAQRDGLPFEFYDYQLSSALDEFRRAIREAAFVVAPQDYTAGVFQELPSWKLRANVAQVLSEEVAAGRLRLLHSYPTQDGGAYQLFVSDAKAAEWTDAFYAVVGWDSFLPWEGPYPKQHLGRVRWAIGQHAGMTLAPDAPGRALLKFSVRADQPVHAAVAVNGVTVTTVDLPGKTGFHDFRVPVELTSDATHLTFDFDRPLTPAPDGIARALLFRQLEVQPAP